jgi:hypothetical protein
MYDRFMKLFTCNQSSYGQFNPKTQKMHTNKEPIGKEQFHNHLDGIMGAGAVPITEDNTCWWGAIDIDNHSGAEINITKIAKDVHDHGLPLVVCGSKSGGAHCYLFASEALPAHFVRNILIRWAATLGHSGAEVFPKQAKLLKDKETGQLQLGNWINLPYFNKTTRQAVIFDSGSSKTLSVNEFLDYADSNKVDQKVVEDFLVVNHREAPPCIQAMIKSGVDNGYRNEALYNLTIYMKKAFPADEYREKVYDLNQMIFEKPLSFAESKKTVISASKRDYKYKCMEEPCRSNCDAEVCLKRAYGITEEDTGSLSRADFPEITDMKIYNMEPPIWEMKLNGVLISITTQQLYNYTAFAQVVMEKLLIVVPPLKNKDWLNKLAGLMVETEKVDTPEDASTPGIIKEKLRDFLQKADVSQDGTDVDQRQMVARGMPVVQILGIEGHKGRHIMFKGTDFVAYLKRTRSEELKGSNLWNVMKHFGVQHSRVRVGGRVTPVWSVPLDEHGRTKLDPDYKTEYVEPTSTKNVATFKSEF